MSTGMKVRLIHIFFGQSPTFYFLKGIEIDAWVRVSNESVGNASRAMYMPTC